MNEASFEKWCKCIEKNSIAKNQLNYYRRILCRQNLLLKFQPSFDKDILHYYYQI